MQKIQEQKRKLDQNDDNMKQIISHIVEAGTVYILLVLHHVHGVLEPLPRKMRTTLTRSVPLHDYQYFSAPHSEMTMHAIPERVQLSI